MKRTYINKFTKGLTAVALVLGMASCSDDLDYELFTKYTYLMNNGWQENIEMEINDDNTVDLPVYFGVNGALDDWFTAYFYNNLFLYASGAGGPAAVLKKVAQSLWYAMEHNRLQGAQPKPGIEQQPTFLSHNQVHYRFACFVECIDSVFYLTDMNYFHHTCGLLSIFKTGAFTYLKRVTHLGLFVMVFPCFSPVFSCRFPPYGKNS